VIDDRNPYDGETVARVPSAKAEDVDRAFELAAAAVRTHADRRPQELAQPVLDAVAVLRDDADEVVDLLVAESGSTVSKARFEVDALASGIMREAASFPFRAFGQHVKSVVPGKENIVQRLPAGVVAADGHARGHHRHRGPGPDAGVPVGSQRPRGRGRRRAGTGRNGRDGRGHGRATGRRRDRRGGRRRRRRPCHARHPPPRAAARPLPGPHRGGRHRLFPARDGHVAELDDDRATSTDLLARHLDGARFVRLVDTATLLALGARGPLATEVEPLRGLVAGDDVPAKDVVAGLLVDLGFEPVDAGGLPRAGEVTA
jgi:hypothetical protein